MNSKSSNVFWDSCVLIRYLTRQPREQINEIRTHLAEAKESKKRMFMSSMVIAEIKPSHLNAGGLHSFQDFVDDLEGALNVVSPSVPILMRASRLRDFSYYQTPQQKNEKTRVLSGMDAVHLATCIHVRDVLGVKDIEFHTFDDGRGTNYEQKAVSLLRYNQFSRHITSDADVRAVCDLPKLLPSHPSPRMFADPATPPMLN